MININNMAYSQIIKFNPICQENEDIKRRYYFSLRKYINAGRWSRRKNIKSQSVLYKNMYQIDNNYIKLKSLDLGNYKYFFIFDFFTLLSYEKKILSSNKMQEVKQQLIREIYYTPEDKEFLENAFDAVLKNKNTRGYFDKHEIMGKYRDFTNAVWTNIDFLYKKPYQILVTATMSAGKSTFINTLVGKNVSLAQNMACTSKGHIVIGKPFEDGCTYKYDYDLNLNANKEELLENSNDNTTDRMTISTYFEGALGGKKIIIKDSPGANFSGDDDHKRIAETMIKNKKGYNLLVYIINGTQMGTDDDAVHLDYVKQYIGNTPILFVINKIDAFDTEEESIEKLIETHRNYLERKGFKNPLIVPVSSRAGLLAKKQCTQALLRYEQRELYSLIDKFEEMDLVTLYEKNYSHLKVENYSCEKLQLLKTSGVRYVEEIIKEFYEGDN